MIAAEEAEFGVFTPKIDFDDLLARALAEEARLPHDHARHALGAMGDRGRESAGIMNQEGIGGGERGEGEKRERKGEY